MAYIIWNVTRQTIVESGNKAMVFADSSSADLWLLRRTCSDPHDPLVKTTGLRYPPFKDLVSDTFQKVVVQ